MSPAYNSAVVLPLKLRSLPSPNVFVKWHPLKESNFPTGFWRACRLILGTLADVEMVAYAGAAPATPE